MENKPNKNTDPFFSSDSPEAVQAALAGMKRAKGANEEKDDHNWGYTVNDKDPEQGYSDDPEAIQAYAEKQIDEAKAEEAKPIRVVEGAPEGEEKQEEVKEEEIKDEVLEEAEKVKEEPEAVEEVKEEEPARTEKPVEEPELTDGEKRLNEVFEKGQEIRDLYKDPGNPRYRLMSVAAVELERINQIGEAKEKINANNQAIEKAAKEACGENGMDRYGEDTVVAVQTYISENLIGGDADFVSIGTTETLVNNKGQIGKNAETFNNLVVIRWLKHGVNHVMAFSPREDAAFYALVDDSVGDSWRRKFLIAGAVKGEERDNMIIANHDTDGFFHHERSLEKFSKKIIGKQAEALQNNEYSQENKAEIAKDIAMEYENLAHTASLPGKPMGSEDILGLQGNKKGNIKDDKNNA